MARNRAVTVGMLEDQTGKPGPHPFLFCESCWAEFSANAADYWDRPISAPFKCCRKNMLLVQRVTDLLEVIPA